MNNMEDHFFNPVKTVERNVVFDGYYGILNFLSPEERISLAKCLFETKDMDYINL